MMSKKCAHPQISIHSVSQRAPLNLNVNYVSVMKYTCTYQISYKTEIVRVFIACTYFIYLFIYTMFNEGGTISYK